MVVSGRSPVCRAAILLPVAVILFLVATLTPQKASGSGDVPAGFEVPNARSPQIVGGSETTFSQHPWLVEITLNGQHFCGGALVHPMLVLTAAHCLYSAENGDYWGNLGPMQAFTSRSTAATGGEELNIAGWGIANNYQPLDGGGTGENDYGFIALQTPSSRPVLKIAGPDEASVWKTGRTALVAGFGNIQQGGPASPVLKALSVPVLADSVCGAADSYGAAFNASNMLCAGITTGGSGTCQGDSGGPLTVPVDGGGRRIVGVVSWGDGCAKPNKPTIYTRVAAPSVSTQVNALAKLIATQANFPGVHADSNLLGSGAKPVGCSAAQTAAAQAQSALSVANERLTKVSKTATKAKKTATKAKKAVAKAKKAVRKAPRKKKARAKKKLKQANKKLKRAKKKLGQAQTTVKNQRSAVAAAKTDLEAKSAQATAGCS